MTNRHLISRLFLIVAFFLPFPSIVNAQVVVSEIMYDLEEGSDTGREWIEVFNNSSSVVDLTAWKLFEADINHKITEVSGGTTLGADAYAIVADNAAKFLTDHPSYTGLLFDSAFSLSNTGETLILRNAELIDKDTVYYTSGMGAAGDGNSLQRTSAVAKTFSAGAPTPGTGTLSNSSNGSGDTEPSNSNQSSSTPETTTATPSVIAYFTPEPQIFVYAGKDRTVNVGADTIFEGKAFNKDGEPLSGNNVRFLWNFGDGDTTEGHAIMHHFAHPSRYAVILDVSSGTNSASARITVTAEPTQFVLTTLSDGSAVIENKSGRELNLSFWHITSGVHRFSLPKGTIVLSKEKIIVPPTILGFNTASDFKLLYPNGAIASSIEEIKPSIKHENVIESQKVAIRIESPTPPTPRTHSLTSEVKEDYSSIETAKASQASSAVIPYMKPLSREGVEENDVLNTWTFGLAALLILGSVGAFFASRARRGGWDIVEEKS